jgi:hypothetical protein
MKSRRIMNASGALGGMVARETTRLEERQWERATRIQAVIATKLRLAPQSRIDRKAVTRHLPPPVRPWEEF